MKEQQILQFIKKFLEEKTLKELDINRETKLNELQINSFLFIQLIVEIELEFDIEFEDEKLLLENYNQLKDMIQYIVECIERS